jgi:predicted nucleotidyltransferase
LEGFKPSLDFKPKMSTIDPVMGTPLVADILSSSLFGKTRKAVLALFFSHPEDSFYLRQVIRMTGSGQGAVQRELKQLAEAGVIERFEQGRQVYFKANKRCPIFPDLKRLILKTAGLVEVLRSAVIPVADRIEQAYVYGSQARGEARAASDVDFFVVGDIDELTLHKSISQAEGHLNRTVNYTLMSSTEYRKRRQEKDGFLSRVLNGEKLFVIGGPDGY